MEKFTQKWAVACLLEDATEGSEFYYTDFPLHVTLAGVFAVHKTGQELVDELRNVLADKHCVKVAAAHKAMFGPNKDVTVMTIKKSAGLINLYSAVYEWLKSAGAVYNSPEYQGEGYLPHSTLQKTGSLKPGEKRILRSVSLIDLFPNHDGYQRKIFKI